MSYLFLSLRLASVSCVIIRMFVISKFFSCCFTRGIKTKVSCNKLISFKVNSMLSTVSSFNRSRCHKFRYRIICPMDKLSLYWNEMKIENDEFPNKTRPEREKRRKKNSLPFIVVFPLSPFVTFIHSLTKTLCTDTENSTLFMFTSIWCWAMRFAYSYFQISQIHSKPYTHRNTSEINRSVQFFSSLNYHFEPFLFLFIIWRYGLCAFLLLNGLSLFFNKPSNDGWAIHRQTLWNGQ